MANNNNKDKIFSNFEKKYKESLLELEKMVSYKKNMHRINYIYFIQNKVTKDIYIGRSIYNVEYRFKQHISSSKRKKSDVYKTPFSYALREYGEDNFNIGYLDCIICHKHEFEPANSLEQKYIKRFCTLYPSGYNISGLSGVQLKSWKREGVNNG